jgi:FkbM family methyltransferase
LTPKKTKFARPDLYDRIMEADLVESHLCAVDAGACVGSWAAAMSEDFREVHAFEPVEASRSILIANCGHRHNINFYSNALWDREAHVRMDADKPKRRTVLTSYFAREERDGNTTAIRMDAIDIQPALIKIDVEGAELKVLMGAQKTIEEYGPVLVIEFADHFHRFGYTEENIMFWLHARGYQEAFRDGVDRVFSVR